MQAREQRQSMKLEELPANAAVRGILSDRLFTVLSVCSGSAPKRLNGPDRKVAKELLCRTLRTPARDGRGDHGASTETALFLLVSEAQRVRLAHLFDPMIALHTSVVEPLPHRITAVILFRSTGTDCSGEVPS